MVSTDWSVPGQGVFSHCSWFWCCPPGFVAFLGLELKYKWGLDVISGGKVRRGHVRGQGPCFPSFAPCPGVYLHLVVNCLASVFSYLSQFSYSTCQWIFLTSYYPVSYTHIPILLTFQTILNIHPYPKKSGTAVIKESGRPYCNSNVEQSDF